MALETWLIKVKNTVKSANPKLKLIHKNTSSSSPKNVGVLAFEIAGLMSKLLHLWQSLSDTNMVRLRNESINLEGVRKIVSNDDSFLLSLACAEIVQNLKLLSNSVSRISQKCKKNNQESSELHSLDRVIVQFASSEVHIGDDRVLRRKEMEAKCRRMNSFVKSTSMLHKQIDELEIMEKNLKKLVQSRAHDKSGSGKEDMVTDIQQKIAWQKQEIKLLKQKSLWCRSFDTVTLMLVKFIFTLVARIKLVFGLVGSVRHYHGQVYPSGLPRSLSSTSASATVYPFASGSLSANNIKIHSGKHDDSSDEHRLPCTGLFEMNSKILNPPMSTLGAAALALHYANLVIVMEKMIRCPQLIGLDAKDDLYAMLPKSIRSSLRSRLKGVGFCASDPVLAGEWRVALGRILGWLSPLAHNMIKWQSERSFEQQNMVPKTNVLLFQTLFFANKEKTEAAITELLVGLNYIWRFEREMNAEVLFDCSNFNRSFKINSQNSNN